MKMVDRCLIVPCHATMPLAVEFLLRAFYVDYFKIVSECKVLLYVF